MSDLALTLVATSDNPIVGDLALRDNAPYLVTDDEAVIQDLWIRLRWFTGEWFLNTDAGIPYREYVLVKNPDMTIIDRIFRTVITDTPGVASLIRLTLNFDRAARTLTPDFDARFESGRRFRSSDYEEFVVRF